MFDKVFISYAKEDYQYAESLYDYLKDNGLDPWLDKKNLLPGQSWDFNIQKALRKADFIILILSQTSVSKRGYIQKEFNKAIIYCEEKLDSDVFIIPIKIDDCAVPEKLSKFQWTEYDSKDSFSLIKKSINDQRKLFIEEKKLDNLNSNYKPFTYNTILEELGNTCPRQSYEIKYPVFIENENESYKELNILINFEILTYIRQARYNFYFELSCINKTSEDFVFHSTDSTMFGSIEIKLLSKKFISFTAYWYIYGTGAAHQNYYTIGYNYYINPLIDFNLDDLFTDFEFAMQKLKEIIEIKLLLRVKTEHEINSLSDFYLSDGIKPERDFFINFYLTNNSIVFIYNPYQLTAFCYGDQHIEISFNDLRRIFPNEKKLIEFLESIEN